MLSLIPEAVCTRQLVLPPRVVNKRLRLAMGDPMDQGLIDELGFVCGDSIHPLHCEAGQMQAKQAELFGAPGQQLDDIATVVDSSAPYEGIEIILDEDGSAEDPPAIRLVNAIILEALRLGASDIHPRTKQVIVRYRIDGVLQDKIQVPSSLLMAVESRIKVMAELDITERRRPQDGRITVKTPIHICDLRISTLHTNSAVASIARLLDLGLKPYVLASALEAIIAQRLVRRLCRHCKEEIEPPLQLLGRLGIDVASTKQTYFRGRGCDQCHQGYKGLVGIHEVLTLNDALRDAIIQGVGVTQLQDLAHQQGMLTLLDDARDKLQQGLTTAEELLRLLGPQDLPE